MPLQIKLELHFSSPIYFSVFIFFQVLEGDYSQKENLGLIGITNISHLEII